MPTAYLSCEPEEHQLKHHTLAGYRLCNSSIALHPEFQRKPGAFRSWSGNTRRVLAVTNIHATTIIAIQFNPTTVIKIQHYSIMAAKSEGGQVQFCLEQRL